MIYVTMSTFWKEVNGNAFSFVIILNMTGNVQISLLFYLDIVKDIKNDKKHVEGTKCEH